MSDQVQEPQETRVKVVGRSGRVMDLRPKIAAGMLRGGYVREATAADVKKQPKPGSALKRRAQRKPPEAPTPPDEGNTEK